MSNEFWKMLFFTIGSLGAYVLHLLMTAFIRMEQAEKSNGRKVEKTRE